MAKGVLDEAVLYTMSTSPRAEGGAEHPEHPPPPVVFNSRKLGTQYHSLESFLPHIDPSRLVFDLSFSAINLSSLMIGIQIL